MEQIRQYILSVTASAVLCGIISGLLGKKGTTAAIGRLLCGIFLAITVLKPLMTLSISEITSFTDSYTADARAAAESGEELANDAMGDIIMQQTQAYILDKADALGVSVSVEVQLSKDTPPIPESVTISGSISPYQRKQLSSLLEEDLGIPEENQVWIG